jgi:hypothetical protein
MVRIVIVTLTYLRHNPIELFVLQIIAQSSSHNKDIIIRQEAPEHTSMASLRIRTQYSRGSSMLLSLYGRA